MTLGLADNTKPGSLASRLRRRRARLFLGLIEHVQGPVRILDVGGTAEFWINAEAPVGTRLDITLLNTTVGGEGSCAFKRVKGDACGMPFADNEFDVVFSNSVIEHVGNLERQQQMADEVRRVGRLYFIQTPNRCFPLEPHFLVPFFQFFPVPLRAWLLTRFDLGWYRREPDLDSARRIVASVRLLCCRRLVLLFPEARIHRERILGLTKSLVAYRV